MTDATNARRTASALSVLAAGMRQFSPAIECVSVQLLKPYPRNARRHSRAQIKQIAASIERFGFNNPVLIADDGEIVAGHGRVAAAKLLGIVTVPAVRLSHLTEVERRAYVIADNKLALNAGWDREMLAIELQGLVDLDFEVELTGFSLAEVDIVLDEARESATDGADASIEDTIPPYRHEGPAVTQPGDLWMLGRHKLICGDAREAGAYAALLGDEAVDLICTDPPYNVPIDGHVCGSGRIRQARPRFWRGPSRHLRMARPRPPSPKPRMIQMKAARDDRIWEIRAMTERDDPATRSYRNPPVEHRFRKGASGNPRGRPRKKRAFVSTKVDGQPGIGFEDRIKSLAIEEAYRIITIREGDRVERIPIIQAILRKVAVAAANGNTRAQQNYLDLLIGAEADRRVATIELLKAAVDYKERWHHVLAERARTGTTGPEPVPHPDDVLIDYETGNIRIDGPVMEDQKEARDQLRAMWPKLERELMGINEQIESDPNNLSLRERQKELTKIVSFVRDDVQKRNVRDTIRTMQSKSTKD